MKSIFILFFLLSVSLFAQNKDSLYDTDLLPPSFHAGRRQALRDKMKDHSVSVVFSYPVKNRSNDMDYPYHQNPDLYYLSGFNYPNSALLVFKQPVMFHGTMTDELLVIEPRDAKEEMWNGKRMSAEEVKSKLKMKSVCYLDSFSFSDVSWDEFSKIYHSYSYHDVRDDAMTKTELFDLLKSFQEQTEKNKNALDANYFYKMMSELRAVKTPEEMVLLRKAIRISCNAHLQVMKKLHPKMTEYQAQAIVEYEFKYHGAEDEGYTSIVGAGADGCIAHYISNRKKFEKNDLLVIDAGAEYHGYTADVTRTLSVNKKFTKEQKLIYELVLKAQLEGIKMCKKGNKFRSTHEATSEIIKKGLLELGIIKDEKDYDLYFYHGTSHYLGLDVHDAGTYGPFQVGEVITVEPGIYIPEGSPCDKKWWNIGVRIEDDILITENEPEVLSNSLPKTIAEIEKVMNGK